MDVCARRNAATSAFRRANWWPPANIRSGWFEMTITPEQQRELERTRYWQGQLLKSGDLNGQVSTDLQLRWWHNRALHNAYGVALGYESKSLVDASGILNGF